MRGEAALRGGGAAQQYTAPLCLGLSAMTIWRSFGFDDHAARTRNILHSVCHVNRDAMVYLSAVSLSALCICASVLSVHVTVDV